MNTKYGYILVGLLLRVIGNGNTNVELGKMFIHAIAMSGENKGSVMYTIADLHSLKLS